MIPLHGKCEHGMRHSYCPDCLRTWLDHMERQREIDEHFEVVRIMSAMDWDDLASVGYYPSRGES